MRPSPTHDGLHWVPSCVGGHCQPLFPKATWPTCWCTFGLWPPSTLCCLSWGHWPSWLLTALSISLTALSVCFTALSVYLTALSVYLTAFSTSSLLFSQDSSPLFRIKSVFCCHDLLALRSPLDNFCSSAWPKKFPFSINFNFLFYLMSFSL